MTTQLAIFAVGFYALEEMRNPSSKFGSAFKEEAGEKVLTSLPCQLALKLTQVESSQMMLSQDRVHFASSSLILSQLGA